MGVVTVIVVVDDVDYSKQPSVSMSIIFWNESFTIDYAPPLFKVQNCPY